MICLEKKLNNCFEGSEEFNEAKSQERKIKRQELRKKKYIQSEVYVICPGCDGEIINRKIKAFKFDNEEPDQILKIVLELYPSLQKFTIVRSSDFKEKIEFDYKPFFFSPFEKNPLDDEYFVRNLDKDLKFYRIKNTYLEYTEFKKSNNKWSYHEIDLEVLGELM